jgi:CheY-like chemotaxis protein
MARILICDNEEPLRALVRAALDGHEIHEARDGDEALDRARALRPDLIVLDMMMPARSGVEVLELLRNEPDLGKTLVVMLTARVQAPDQAAAERLGADRLMPKPFSPLRLADTVEELLETRR